MCGAWDKNFFRDLTAVFIPEKFFCTMRPIQYQDTNVPCILGIFCRELHGWSRVWCCSCAELINKKVLQARHQAMQNVVQKLLLALLLILIFEKSILSYSQSFTFNHTSDEYRLVVTPILNFTNAHATCFSSFGGSLAMFTTLSHYLAVNTLVRTHSAANYYIGATDVVTEGAYLWMDGTPLNFTNWIPCMWLVFTYSE